MLIQIYKTFNTSDIYRILINNIVRSADLKLKFCARGFAQPPFT